MVVLKRDKEGWGLEAGDVGTVVLVYPHGGYVVGFVDHEFSAAFSRTLSSVRWARRRVRLVVAPRVRFSQG